MESRAKQRLTGAVILVALFVLLVPELLTGPRNAHPPAASTNEEGMSSYTIDLDGHAAAANPTTAPTNNAAVSLPAVPAPPAAARAVPGEAASAVAPTAKPSATNPMAQPPPNNVAAAPASSPSPAQPTHTEPARPEAPHAAMPASAPSSKPVAAGNFVVQLGTFGQRENADRLARDMKAKGFAALVVPVASNGHELYRVRVGPTRDRASAEALATQLKRAGQSGTVVPIS